MRWADARGDSLPAVGARPAAAGGRVHRLLRRALHGRVGRRAHRRPPAGDPPRPQRRLLDGRHGRHRRGRGGLGGAGRGHRRRAARPDHLHELVGRAEGVRRRARRRGVHLDQRPGGARVGPRPRATRCSSSPTSTSAATPAWPWATATTTCGCGTRASSSAASPRPTARTPPSCCGRATARSTSGSGPSTSRRSGPSTPTASSIAHPECSHEVCDIADQVGSTDYIIKAVEAAAAGSAHRRRHRDPPRAAAGRRAPRQDRRLARPAHLPVLDDVPHRRPAPGWVLENLVEGTVVNRITVDPDTTEWAKVALQRMLDITEAAPRTEVEAGGSAVLQSRGGRARRPSRRRDASRRGGPSGRTPRHGRGAGRRATTSGPRSASCPATSRARGSRRIRRSHRCRDRPTAPAGRRAPSPPAAAGGTGRGPRRRGSSRRRSHRPARRRLRRTSTAVAARVSTDRRPVRHPLHVVTHPTGAGEPPAGPGARAGGGRRPPAPTGASHRARRPCCARARRSPGCG